MRKALIKAKLGLDEVRGATSTEYVILLAVIAIGLIGGLVVLANMLDAETLGAAGEVDRATTVTPLPPAP